MSRSTDTPTDPWRAELTPRSQASRRRWTVVLAVLLLALGAGALDDRIHDALLRDGPGARAFLYVILLLVVFGLLRRGTRRLGRLRGGKLGDLDERDTAARDRAFRTAFFLFVAVAVATVWSLDAFLPQATRSVNGSVEEGVVLGPDDVESLVAWFVMWAVFLPTAALAWREPDAPPADDDDPRPALGELTRDGLVAASLLAGAVISAVVPDNNAGTEIFCAPLPFVVLAVAVGVLHTRGTGRSWAQAAVGDWRMAAVLAIVVGLAVAVGVSGGLSADRDDPVTSQGLPAPGVYETTEVTPGKGDDPDTERRCLGVIDRRGRDLFGAAARREARRLGADPRRVCE
jgi:hypothetical protein